jgi:hypothetical protein
MTSFSGSDYAATRIPINAFRVKIDAASLGLEAAWIPSFTPQKLPVEDDNPLSKIARPKSAVVSGMALPVAWAIKSIPSGIDAGEYAARASWSGSILDVSACGFYGWDALPATTKAITNGNAGYPSGITVTGDWNRIWMVGADASVPVDPFVARLEGAYVGDRLFALSGLGAPKRKNEIVGMVGLDWNSAGWTVTAQYLEDWIVNYEDDIDQAGRKQAITMSVSKAFLRETLAVSASGYLEPRDMCGYGKLSAVYGLDDSTAIEIGTNVFYGGPENNGEFEAYEFLNSVYIKGSYHF